MSQCAWWGHHSWCQLPWHHQHSPMEDGWFRDAAQTPTPPRAVAGGTTLPCQPVPCSCTELSLPSPVCAPRAAALPSLPSLAPPGLTLPTLMVLGEQPQSPLPAPLPCSPPGPSPLSGRGTRVILNQNCQVPSGFSGPSPRHQAVTSLGCWQCLEKGTYCQGAFLTHHDLWPSLKPKNPPCLHGHFWKRAYQLCPGISWL